MGLRGSSGSGGSIVLRTDLHQLGPVKQKIGTRGVDGWKLSLARVAGGQQKGGIWKHGSNLHPERNAPRSDPIGALMYRNTCAYNF